MRLPVAACTAYLALTGCSNTSNDRVLALVDSLGIVIDSLQEKFQESELERWSEERAQGTAFLTPSDQGYDTIRMDFGTITVSLENVVAYANGSRVSLQFGNTTSATISDITAHLQWGSVNDKGIPNYASARSRDVKIDKSLGAGRWTTITLVLDAVPPAQLGFVRISDFKNGSISLLR